MELKEKIKQQLCVTKNDILVIREDEEELIVRAVAQYINTVIKLSRGRLNEDLLLSKISSLDFIRLSEVEELLDYSIVTSPLEEKQKDTKEGIILEDGLTKNGVYSLFRSFTEQITENEVSDNFDEIKPRFYMKSEFDESLRQGFIEYFTSSIWKKICEEKSLEEAHDSRYFAQGEIAGVLIDLMGFSDSLCAYVKNPHIIMKHLQEVHYEKKPLLDYLEDRLKKLPKGPKPMVAGIVYNNNVLDCIEAMSDCSPKLQLKPKVYQKTTEKKL